MMHNQNGFTLIESIITFAILTIAGIMFMFGFTNVSTLASEGSMIKTETDQLYYDLMSQAKPGPITITSGKDETIIPAPEAKPIEIIFNDNSEASLNNVYISTKKQKVKDFDISLSKLVAKNAPDFLPNDVADAPVKEDTTTKVEFNIINSNANLPGYDLTNKNWNRNGSATSSINQASFITLNQSGTYYSNVLTDKIKRVADGTTITTDISSYLLEIPPEVLLNATTGSSYIVTRHWIMGSYFNLYESKSLKLIWFAIHKQNINGQSIAKVYGFLVPTDGKYAIFNGKIDEIGMYGLGGGLLFTAGFGLMLQDTDYSVINTDSNVSEGTHSGKDLKSLLSTTRNQVFNETNGLWYIY